MDGDHPTASASEMRAAVSEKGIHQFEWMALNADDQEPPVLVTLFPVVIEGRDHTVVINRDITEAVCARPEKQAR